MSEAKCNQMVSKKITNIFVYSIDEECGCNAKHEIEYTLPNGNLFNKTVCKRHLKSNIAWLDRIKVKYITKDI